jgi:2'-5' RNA ligase
MFVAVVPPVGVREQLHEALRPLRTEVPDVAWEASSRWHVTLCFLGQVDSAPVLLDGLGAVARAAPPIPMRVAGAGCFGDHVLWAGVEGRLGALAQALAGAAHRAGVEIEDRPFQPHLTLARRRRRTSVQPLAAQLSTLVTGSWSADEVVLLQSGRPDYGRLAAWPLCG